jgi:hypothetical protein
MNQEELVEFVPMSASTYMQTALCFSCPPCKERGWPSEVVDACDPSTQKTEVERSQVQGQPELLSKTLSQKE